MCNWYNIHLGSTWANFSKCSVVTSLFLSGSIFLVCLSSWTYSSTISTLFFEIIWKQLWFINIWYLVCPACRLGNDDNLNTGQSTSGIFVCAVCQVDLAPSEGISVHAGSIFSTSSKPWQGPFLCSDCRDKKDAMEGKRPSGVKVS